MEVLQTKLEIDRKVWFIIPTVALYIEKRTLQISIHLLCLYFAIDIRKH